MSNNDHEASYEYLCRTCGHHERKHAGYPLACVVCDSHNLLRTPLFREPKPGEYDIWARDQHIEVLKAEVERLRAEVARLEAKSKALRAECSDLWEVIERAKDALPRYDGLYVADVAETLEILQGALDEEPNNAS